MKRGKSPGGEHVAKHKNKTPAKKGRKALLIVCIILAVIAAAAAIYAIWERPPEVGKPGATPTPANTAPVQTAKPDQGTAPGTDAPDAPAETEPPEEDYANALVTDRAPGTYTFLLVGRDHASNSTDTIIVGRMDTKAHTINFVNIPRDTLINITWGSTPKKINTVYPGFINSGKDGVEGLKTHVKNLLGFDVDCYAVVSIKAVEQAVDAIGGVWFDVPIDMFYGDPMQDLSICINKGYQLLSGEDAVKVCRYRYTYEGGDIERIGVQQDFLKALASQILTVGNIPNMGALIDILVENLDTDLTAANIAWFARQFLKCSADNITFQTMPWSTGCVINNTSYVSVDLNKWLELVNDKLNPYVEPVTVMNVNILTSNYSGTSMNATNGVIAGGPDSFYCLTCTLNNGGVAVHHLPEQHLSFSAPEPETPPDGESNEE